MPQCYLLCTLPVLYIYLATLALPIHIEATVVDCHMPNGLQVGLILHQGCVPEKCFANHTQNSYLNSVFPGVTELTTSSYVVYDCTTGGHTDLWNIYVLYRVGQNNLHKF